MHAYIHAMFAICPYATEATKASRALLTNRSARTHLLWHGSAVD